MTKTERLKLIRKDFFTYVEEKYPNVVIYDEGAYVSIDLFDSGKGDEMVDFQRSTHEIIYLSMASDEVKKACDDLNIIIRTIENKYPIE